MKLKLDDLVIYLGRRRKDGRRNVERVRLPSWRALLPKLRKAKIAARMDGDRLTVRLLSDSQMLLPFLQETG